MTLWIIMFGLCVSLAVIYGFEALICEGDDSRRAARIASTAGAGAYLLLHFRLFLIG